MLKDLASLRLPDPYFSGAAGFVASTLEELHLDMSGLELPASVPAIVRKSHDGVRNAYVYAYFSYDLLTLAAAQMFPCLELALRERVGQRFEGRVYRNGRSNPARLNELLELARRELLITTDFSWVAPMRNMYAHGSDTVVNAPMFLDVFRAVTALITDLFLN